MSTVAIAWTTYLAGLVTATAFVVLYLHWIRLWRPRPDYEKPATVRARRFILTLTAAFYLRYVTGIVSLVVSGTHPTDALPNILGGVLTVVVQLWLLYLLIKDRVETKREGRL